MFTRPDFRQVRPWVWIVAVLLVAESTTLGAWLWTTRDADRGSPADYGESRLTEVMASLRSGDVDSVVSRLGFKALPCGIALQAGDQEIPGPKCLGDEVEGTTVAVFPIVTCEVQFVRSVAAADFVRNSLRDFDVYGAIKLRHPIRRSPYADLQEGFYGVVGTATEERSSGPAARSLRGVMVSLAFDGSIVNLWPGCGEFASGLADDRFREALLFGPGK